MLIVEGDHITHVVISPLVSAVHNAALKWGICNAPITRGGLPLSGDVELSGEIDSWYVCHRFHLTASKKAGFDKNTQDAIRRTLAHHQALTVVAWVDEDPYPDCSRDFSLYMNDYFQRARLLVRLGDAEWLEMKSSAAFNIIAEHYVGRQVSLMNVDGVSLQSWREPT
jgi:hypothetical protein